MDSNLVIEFKVRWLKNYINLMPYSIWRQLPENAFAYQIAFYTILKHSITIYHTTDRFLNCVECCSQHNFRIEG